MKNYIYYLLLLALSISCTANKKGIDKTEKQTDQLVYTHVSGENLKSDSTLWGMKIDFVKDGHLFIQELSNDLLYGVYRIEDDSLIKEGGKDLLRLFILTCGEMKMTRFSMFQTMPG